MKKFIQAFIFLFVLVPCFSQGIEFKNLNWKESLTLAQSQEKFIFVELQTSWCSNCRKLEKKTFSDESVGNLMNEHFINLKYNAEEGRGYEIASFFKVSAYPTMLFFDSNGIVQMRLVGYKKIEAFKTVAQHIRNLRTDKDLAALIGKIRVENKPSSDDLKLIRGYYGSFYYPEWPTHVSQMFSSWNEKEQTDSLNLSFLGDNFSVLNDTIKYHVVRHTRIPNVFDDRMGEIIRRQRYIEEDLVASIDEAMDKPVQVFTNRLKMYKAFQLNTNPNIPKDKYDEYINSKKLDYFIVNENYEAYSSLAESLVEEKVFSVSDQERMNLDYGSAESFNLLSDAEKEKEILQPTKLRKSTQSLLEFITPMAKKYLELFSDKKHLETVIDWSDHAIHLFPRSINYIHKIKALDKLGLKDDADRVILEALEYKQKEFGMQQFNHFVNRRNNG